MSVPHLDLRVVDDKHYLLFGPFASFKPRLERGRGFFDYLRSIRLHDIPGLLNVALEHFPLVKYLVSDTFKGEKTMFEELDSFAPGLSKRFDWKPVQAGQQIKDLGLSYHYDLIDAQAARIVSNPPQRALWGAPDNTTGRKLFKLVNQLREFGIPSRGAHVPISRMSAGGDDQYATFSLTSPLLSAAAWPRPAQSSRARTAPCSSRRLMAPPMTST